MVILASRDGRLDLGGAYLCLVAGLFALLPPRLARGQEDGLASLELGRSRGGLPSVEARLAGRLLQFAVDTGATRSTISGELARELGFVARDSYLVRDASDALREANCAGPVEFDLAGVVMRSDCLGWIEGTRVAGRVDQAEGVLGFDALSSADLWIDLARSRMVLSSPGRLRDRVAGVAVPFEDRYGRPMITAEPVSGRFTEGSLRLVIDSGSKAVVLFGAAARDAERGPQRGRPAILTAAHSRRFVRSGHLGRILIGPVSLDLERATLLPDVEARAEDGVLPLATLGPVLFDPQRGEIVLEATLAVP